MVNKKELNDQEKEKEVEKENQQPRWGMSMNQHHKLCKFRIQTK